MQVIDWQVIVKMHGPIVWQTAYRLLGSYEDTADCFQETFVCALEVSRRQRIRNFPALLVRLTTSRAIDLLRQRCRKSRYNVNLPDWPNVPDEKPDPVQQAQSQELAVQLRNAIGQLPPQEAKAFCLRYLSDMSYRQIAKELEVDTNTAGVLLHRARAKLRELLQLSHTEKNEVVL